MRRLCAGRVVVGEVATRMRRSFGPISGSGWQDILMAQGPGGKVRPNKREDDFEAWVAYSKAQMQLRKGKRGRGEQWGM